MHTFTTEIIIISYNCLDLTVQCIESILNTKENYTVDICVVDNASKDETVQHIKQKYPDIRVIANDSNLGYAGAVNIGAKSSKADYIFISNADIIYHPNAIIDLIEYLDNNEEIGACGPQQVFPDGSWQYSYGDLPGVALGLKDLFLISTLKRALRKLTWNYFKIDRFPKDVPYTDGAVIATKKKAFDSVNGFDEDYFFYTEEADYCYKLQTHNWAVINYPKAIVTHFRGGSTDDGGLNKKMVEIFLNSKMLFCKKHNTEIGTKLFVRLECLHNTMMKKLWSLLSNIMPSQHKNKAQNKAEYFTIISDGWKNLYKNNY